MSVTLRCAEQHNQLSKRITRLVIPLGATVCVVIVIFFYACFVATWTARHCTWLLLPFSLRRTRLCRCTLVTFA
jgi:Na+/H+-dicarboxylate symporter